MLKARHVANLHAGQSGTELLNGTNEAEYFFSQLEHPIDGTHHCISQILVQRYLTELAFRDSTHGLTQTERLVKLLGQDPGDGLSYKSFIMP